jgi:hypothetical protein
LPQSSAAFPETASSGLKSSLGFLPGITPPRGQLYSKAVEEYIEDSLAAGGIHPSVSTTGTGFFGVEKKDKTLCPCIDYQALTT